MTYMKNCPGSAAVKDPTLSYVECSNCGAEVEIWSIDTMVPCDSCGTKVFRERRPSCIDWCDKAEECVGSELYKEMMEASGSS
jgi:DNA-directed RNA polymerase subunit RPC12/RpoP